MNTQCAHVRSGLAGHPEDTHVSLLVVVKKLEFVNISDTELFLDSRDQRRTLEASASERVKCLLQFLHFVKLRMQLYNSHVLLTSRLLGLHETRGIIDAGDQATSDFGIKSARMARLIDFEDLLDPGDDFMGAGVRRFVQVDHSILLQDVEWAFCGRKSAGQRREVGGFDVQFIEMLKRVRQLFATWQAGSVARFKSHTDNSGWGGECL